MDKKQAWEILEKVAMAVSATRQDHHIIDQALAALKPEEK
jgi:hypothetical protein